MTEDLSIKQRPSALPYLAGGAVFGAGAGLVANHTVPYLKGSPMTHEDIIKEVKDTTSFSNRTAEGAEHATSWKEVGEKYEAWQKAELGTPKDEKLVKEYNDALTRKEATLKTYTEQELNAAKRGSGTVAKVEPWANLAEAPKIEGKTVTEVQSIYSRLQGDYATAVANAQADAKYVAFEQQLKGNGLSGKKKIKGLEEKLGEEFTTAFNKISGLSKKQSPEKAWADLLGKPSRGLAKPAKGMWKFAEEEITANAEFLRNIEGAETGLTKKPGKEFISASYKEPVLDTAGRVVKDQSGNPKTVIRYVAVEKEAAETALRNARQTLVDEIYTAAQSHVKAQTELNELATTIGNKYKAQFEKCVPGATIDVSTLNEATLKTDLEALKKLTGHAPDRLNPTEQGLIDKYISVGKKGGKARAGEAVRYVEAQLNAATEYAAETKRLEAELKELISGNSRVQRIQGKMDSVIAKNKGVKDVLKELRKQFPDLFPKTTGTAMTEAEAATKALERFNSSRAGQEFAELAKRYEEAAAKNINTEAVATAKGEFEKAAKSLGEKYLKGGKAKWLAPAAGAVVLGLCALGLRPKSEA